MNYSQNTKTEISGDFLKGRTNYSKFDAVVPGARDTSEKLEKLAQFLQVAIHPHLFKPFRKLAE